VRSGWIEEQLVEMSRVDRLTAGTARTSRSGFGKTRSKPPKTRSTTKIDGHVVDGDREGLNGDGLGGGLDGG
jgi:hypothetical protein